MRFGQSTCSTYASKTIVVVFPIIAKHEPMPYEFMLASKVMFFPRLRGKEQRAPRPSV